MKLFEIGQMENSSTISGGGDGSTIESTLSAFLMSVDTVKGFDIDGGETQFELFGDVELGGSSRISSQSS
jgi:hypothetical protein